LPQPRPLKEEPPGGRGEVSLLRLELPQHLVDRRVADLEGEGLRVVSVTRRGGACVPAPGAGLAEGDVVRLAVEAGARGRLDALLAEEATREEARRGATRGGRWWRGAGSGAPTSPTPWSGPATGPPWWSRPRPPPGGPGRRAA